MKRRKGLRDFLLLHVVPPLGAGLVRVIGKSMRLEEESPPPWEDLSRAREGIIVAFWHGRLLMMPLTYRGRRIAVLISQHRDGEIISRTVSTFGFSTIRGSSSRGGGRALRRMAALLKAGTDIAITPDGPRGPRHRVQAGVILLARLSGCPIYPLTFASDRFRSFGSWDRFQVPKFFSRGIFGWGQPLRVRESDDLEDKRQELERVLLEITTRADARYRISQGAVSAHGLSSER